MTRRRRVGLFAAIVAGAVAVIVGVVIAAVVGGGGSSDRGGASGPGAAVPIARGDLLLLDRDRAHPADWGRLIVRRTGDGGAVQRLGALTCERVAYAGGAGICLAQSRRFPTPAYQARFFDARQRVTGTATLNGTPSRARVSPDGRYAASTTFVSGDSYTNPGAFSTRTKIYDVRAGGALRDLEDSTVLRDGQPFHSKDFNFWGVTFAGTDGTFYATLATGDHHYLVRGNVRSRDLVVVRDGVECPSVSPDGTRIGFKARVGDPWQWRFHVLDLRTGRETQLTETRSIDDQIAWLDNDRLAYGVGEEVFTVRADGRGQPRKLARAATNPGRV